MAITVDIQENPKVSVVAKRESDATVITSGYNSSKAVTYQIDRMDGQERITLSSASQVSYEQVLSITPVRLKIILPGRQLFRVRVKQDGGSWTTWKEFKTRDKRYQSPDACWQPSYEFDSDPARKRNKTIVVTNNAKATERRTSRGAIVVNSDTVYNGTTSIRYTGEGATIVNDSF